MAATDNIIGNLVMSLHPGYNYNYSYHWKCHSNKTSTTSTLQPTVTVHFQIDLTYIIYNL